LKRTVVKGNSVYFIVKENGNKQHASTCPMI